MASTENLQSFDPSEHGWAVQEDHGFIDLVGPFWRKTTTGNRYRYGFSADPRHVNLLSVVQGGMLMTFADRAMGLEAWTAADGAPCATVQFSAQFASGGKIGSFLEIEPVVIRKTASLVFMSGSVTQGDEVVLQAHGTWKILERSGKGSS
ncbi:PaaI family thioesterase [Hoeflea sp.]|uniref:PaaI family thioesterase n=1 Tax=Hoeflea sp. TaxID=1940281 RepID=UPI003B5221DE